MARCDDQRLEQIDVREKAASPGPWAKPGLKIRSRPLAGRVLAVMATGDAEAPFTDQQIEADGAFMAESRTDVPDLLADLREARGEIVALRRRYETPLYPLVVDDALVEVLERRSGAVPVAELRGPARTALANRRRMAELLAKAHDVEAERDALRQALAAELARHLDVWDQAVGCNRCGFADWPGCRADDADPQDSHGWHALDCPLRGRQDVADLAFGGEEPRLKKPRPLQRLGQAGMLRATLPQDPRTGVELVNLADGSRHTFDDGCVLWVEPPPSRPSGAEAPPNHADACPDVDCPRCAAQSLLDRTRPR